MQSPLTSLPGKCVTPASQQLMLWTLCMQTLAIWKVTWRLFLGALPFKLINDAATFVGPIFLNLLLGVVSEGKSSAVGYSYAGLMFVGLVIGTLCDNQHFQRVMRAGAVHFLLLLPVTLCSLAFYGPGFVASLYGLWQCQLWLLVPLSLQQVRRLARACDKLRRIDKCRWLVQLHHIVRMQGTSCARCWCTRPSRRCSLSRRL